jgi:hypothetical protein
VPAVFPLDERKPKIVCGLEKLTLPDSGKAKGFLENR